MKRLLPLLVLAAIAADYVLTGTSKPVDVDTRASDVALQASVVPNTANSTAYQSSFDAPPRVVDVELPSHRHGSQGVGFPDQPGRTSSDLTALIPRPVPGTPPGLNSPRTDIAEHIDSGATHLDAGVRQVPGYVVEYARSIERHGIKAFLYDDPELKAKGAAIGQQIGAGIRDLAVALSKDLTAGVQEAHGRP